MSIRLATTMTLPKKKAAEAAAMGRPEAPQNVWRWGSMDATWMEVSVFTPRMV